MSLPRLGATRARELAARFSGVRALVVGDVMLDRFIVGRVTRISPEAPVPVVRYESEHTRLGGAANVAHNLSALGAQVVLVGIIGRDDSGKRLRRELAAAGISDEGLIEDGDRRTVEKVRIVTERNQQVARLDYEAERDIEGGVLAHVDERLTALGVGANVILVSDYLKGIVTRDVMHAVLALKAGLDVPLLVDPKIPHLDMYAGATIITPNHHEAETATHRRIQSDADARDAAIEFRTRAKCDAVLITRGEQGMWLLSEDQQGAIAAHTREVSDVTGAGDTVAAALALALAAGATLSEAAVLANHAAGVVVAKFGAATVTRDELLASIS